MADLTITAANVIGRGKSVPRVAGTTIAAGEVVYEDSADGTVKLADNDSATAAVRVVKGIALNGGASGQPIQVHLSGPITIGATVAVGTVYALSSTAGKICPVADINTGDYNTILGVGISTTQIDVDIHAAGAPVA